MKTCKSCKSCDGDVVIRGLTYCPPCAHAILQHRRSRHNAWRFSCEPWEDGEDCSKESAEPAVLAA